MVFFVITVVIFLSAIFQVSFLSHFEFFGALPNLTLAIVISWCLLKDFKYAFFWALSFGIMLDLFSGTAFFGFHMISLILTVLVVYLLAVRLMDVGDDIVSRIGVIIFATVFQKIVWLIIFLSIGAFASEIMEFIGPLIKITPGEVIINTIFMLIVFKGVQLLNTLINSYNEKMKAKA